MNILKLASKNVFYKPLSSLMSMLLFALSAGLVIFLLLFNHQFKKGLDNNLAGIDLVIGAKGSPLQLILSSMYHIDAPTGNIPIQNAAPFLNPAHPLITTAIPLSLGDSYNGYRIVGTPPSILMLYGANEIQGSVYEHDHEVLIGNSVSKKLDLHIGDEFYSTHGLEENPDLMHDHGSPFRVTGILGSTGTVLDQLILCTPQTIWKVHEHDSTNHDHSLHEEINNHVHIGHEGQIDTAVLIALSDTMISDLRNNPDKEITSMLIKFRSRTNIQSLNLLRNINQNTEMMAASPPYEINRLYAMMGSGAETIRYLAGLIGIVAAISIFISLYNSLKERQYEMALMRVGGAGPMQILWMIIMEGMWISIAGLMIGILLGHAGMEVAGGILNKDYHYSFTGFIWVSDELYVVIGSIAIGLLASIIPAFQGSRVELHKTLAES